MNGKDYVHPKNQHGARSGRTSSRTKNSFLAFSQALASIIHMKNEKCGKSFPWPVLVVSYLREHWTQRRSSVAPSFSRRCSKKRKLLFEEKATAQARKRPGCLIQKGRARSSCKRMNMYYVCVFNIEDKWRDEQCVLV